MNHHHYHEATKRLFGLRTVAFAFEYGAVFGALAGTVGGIMLANHYHDDSISPGQKMHKISKLAAYSVGAIAIFAGTIHIVASIKIKG